MQYVPMLASYAYPAANRAYRSSKGGAPKPRLRGSKYPKRRTTKPGKPIRFKTSRKKTVKSVSKEVQEVKKILKTSQTTLTHRYRDTGTISVDNNQSVHETIGINLIGRMLGTLNRCPAVDIANPGTIIEVNLSSGTFQREVLFKKIYAHLKLRNNALTPVKVKVYCVQTKKDTDVGPRQAVYNGLEDVMSTAQIFSAHVFPTDSFLFKENFAIVNTKSKTLQPGKELDIYSVVENIIWDQSVVESEANTYQRNLKTRAFLVRLEGVPAHNDGVLNQVGALKGMVDYVLDSTHELHYDGGASGINRLIITDNSAALAPGTVAMQPCSCMEIYADNHADRIANQSINFQTTTLVNIQNLLEELTTILTPCEDDETEPDEEVNP